MGHITLVSTCRYWCIRADVWDTYKKILENNDLDLSPRCDVCIIIFSHLQPNRSILRKLTIFVNIHFIVEGDDNGYWRDGLWEHLSSIFQWNNWSIPPTAFPRNVLPSMDRVSRYDTNPSGQFTGMNAHSILKFFYASYCKNFQTGLAVDDVKDILSTAEVRKLKSKVNLSTMNNPFDSCILYTLTDWPNCEHEPVD